jgi:hypothetical protein
VGRHLYKFKVVGVMRKASERGSGASKSACRIGWVVVCVGSGREFEARLETGGWIGSKKGAPRRERVGSGIIKMIAIGLGKHRGAIVCHAAASRLGHEAVIRAVARVALRRAPILCGVAIVEDQKHETTEIQILKP